MCELIYLVRNSLFFLDKDVYMTHRSIEYVKGSYRRIFKELKIHWSVKDFQGGQGARSSTCLRS